MRRVRLLLAAALVCVAAAAPGLAYQPWYAKVTRSLGATAHFQTGGVRATIDAAVVEQIEDADPEASPPQTSTVMRACAFVIDAQFRYDDGCGTIPVVVDAQLGTASAAGTISAANCDQWCPRGTITLSVSWTATGPYTPAASTGQPFSIFLLPPGAEVFPSASVSRAATAVGSATSSLVGTAGGTDAAASIWERLYTFAAVY